MPGPTRDDKGRTKAFDAKALAAAAAAAKKSAKSTRKSDSDSFTGISPSSASVMKKGGFKPRK